MNLSSLLLRLLLLVSCFTGLSSNYDYILAQSLDIDEASQDYDVDPTIIENSPLIQEWIQEIPDVSAKIRHQPSFRTLVRFGYAQFPSSNQSGGIYLGVEDVFLGNTPLTFSADYSTNLNDDSNPKSDRLSVGGNLKYYLLPLGNYINVAPLIGYRYIETNDYQTDGVNVGIKVILALSPKGATDISLSQSFISPTGSEEVGLTEIRAGYAINKQLRLSAGVGWQNSVENADSQISVGLEWMP